MVRPNILESTPLSISEVKEELSKIQKRDEELNFRAKKTEEYINYVPKLSIKKSKEAFEALQKLEIPRLKETHLKKFIDVMPVNEDDAKVILQGQPINVTKDNLKKIVSALDKFR